MHVDLIPVKQEEKEILSDLLQLYLYELSAFKDIGINEQGKFDYYKYLDLYWTEPDRFAYFIKADGKLAGFVLINKHAYLNPKAKVIAEFFVLKKYRRRGIGKQAATNAFDLFPGPWEVAETMQNISAQNFWRSIIKEYTGGAFQEKMLVDERWKGPVQQFDTSDKKSCINILG